MSTLTAIITLIDEVKASVRGLRAIDQAQMVKKYALKAKNYFFSPRYKIGAWDGNINFFSEYGGTYVYLLPSILDDLTKMGYEISLVDKRVGTHKKLEPVYKDHFGHITYPDTGEPIELADHQLRVTNALLAAGHGIAVAATGAGKTLITAALVDRLTQAGLRTLVIVPSLDLITNTRRELSMCGIATSEFSGETKDVSEHVVISTWQSLKNVPIMVRNFTAVIVDETHGARSTELKKLLQEFGSHIVHRFGLTGTMPDDPVEALTVHTCLGEVVATVSASELIDLGWLSTLHIDTYELVEDLRAEYQEHIKQPLKFGETHPTYKEFKKQYFPDHKSEMAYLHANKHRTQWIANMVSNQVQHHGNTFILVSSIEFGTTLASLIPGAVFLNGKDKSKVRQQVYDLFQHRDDNVVIATVHIAGTGINIKRIFNLVLIDLGKSFIRTIQSIGRGLRRGRDKDHLRVLDIGSDLKYSSKHLTERVKYYTAANYPVKRHKVDTNQ